DFSSATYTLTQHPQLNAAKARANLISRISQYSSLRHSGASVFINKIRLVIPKPCQPHYAIIAYKNKNQQI
ncbi:MAG: hypothetical protein R6U42_00005, partial [Halomonas sp.]